MDQYTANGCCALECPVAREYTPVVRAMIAGEPRVIVAGFGMPVMNRCSWRWLSSHGEPHALMMYNTGFRPDGSCFAEPVSHITIRIDHRFRF